MNFCINALQNLNKREILLTMRLEFSNESEKDIILAMNNICAQLDPNNF